MSVRMFLNLYGLRRNLRLKSSEIEKMQIKKLREIIWHAYSNVPFYHAKFRSAGIKPDDVKSLDDLRRVPLTTKFEVQSCDFRDAVSSGVDVKSLIKRNTSGSTGIPLTVFADERVDSFYAAVWLRAMLEVGLRVRDRIAVIADPRGFPTKKSIVERLGVTKHKYISIFDSAKRQLALLKEFKPDIVNGYTSSLLILADEFGEAMKEVGARLVFSGAEFLDESARKLITSAFGAELFDFYACKEFGLLAWECKEHYSYHINADSVLLEFLDGNGEAVMPGERGRIVCTGLSNYVMPLIRYELDDVAIPVDEECSCGIGMSLIKLVEGRVDDFLLATDGRLISPTVFFPFPFDDVDWIRQFRVIQESRKKLVIQVVNRETFSDKGRIIKGVEGKIRGVFGKDMEVELQFVEEVPRDPSGKIRKVISPLNKKHRHNN